MWIRLFIFSAFFFVTALAAATKPSARPTPCPAGTTYKKDCNTCTCGDTAAKDKCGQVDCSRAASATTGRTPTGDRPGTCPTRVTEAPGSNDCKKRTTTSTCVKDTDCGLGNAKKCCQDGCGKWLCRNPIYNYTK